MTADFFVLMNSDLGATPRLQAESPSNLGIRRATIRPTPALTKRGRQQVKTGYAPAGSALNRLAPINRRVALLEPLVDSRLRHPASFRKVCDPINEVNGSFECGRS